MNEEYFNGKYNLISNYKIPELPENIIIRTGTIEDCAFKIRQEELINDEIFSGNIIVNFNFKEVDFGGIIQLTLNDNMLYTNDFQHTPYHHSCICDDKLLYCSSVVLWIIAQRKRKIKNSLYAACRSHRIKLKKMDLFEV
ncbi:MAG: hypothetical protein H8E55_06725 [Pelagibacterales bacterium]|nr:hypothetical protein [Pelagibacterales bacterium]